MRERNAPKSERERPSTLRDWQPCPPIQRGGRRQSRPGVSPFISALTVVRCPATFPGVWPQLRVTLSTNRSVGRGTGAFLYALPADETRAVLVWCETASTALVFCRFNFQYTVSPPPAQGGCRATVPVDTAWQNARSCSTNSRVGRDSRISCSTCIRAYRSM